jgi:hypothetical protein
MSQVTLLIAGSRNWNDPERFRIAINDIPWNVVEVVSGCEPNGVDKLGQDWAKAHGIPVKPFPPDWDMHGKAAGPIRNREMAQYVSRTSAWPRLFAVWDGQSPGTKNMIEEARKLHIPTFIWYV